MIAVGDSSVSQESLDSDPASVLPNILNDGQKFQTSPHHDFLRDEQLQDIFPDIFRSGTEQQPIVDIKSLSTEVIGEFDISPESLQLSPQTNALPDSANPNRTRVETKTEPLQDMIDMYTDQINAGFRYSPPLPGAQSPQIVILNPDGTFSNGEGVSQDDIRNGLYTEVMTQLPATSPPSGYRGSAPRVSPASLPPLIMPPNMMPPNMMPPNMIPPNKMPLNMMPPNMIPPHMMSPEMFHHFMMSLPNPGNQSSSLPGRDYQASLPAPGYTNSYPNSLNQKMPRHSNSLAPAPPHIKQENVGGGYEEYYNLLEELNKMPPAPGQLPLQSPQQSPPLLGPCPPQNQAPQTGVKRESPESHADAVKRPQIGQSIGAIGQAVVSPEQSSTFPAPSQPQNQEPQTGLKRKSDESHATVVAYKRPKTGPSITAMSQAVNGSLGKTSGNCICPICRFEGVTKNPYRHLQDHMARVHFKERLERELPQTKPFFCPTQECQGRIFSDWQAMQRHYIGNKHGILEKYVYEYLGMKENAGIAGPSL